jgi:hypothetical protein
MPTQRATLPVHTVGSRSSMASCRPFHFSVFSMPFLLSRKTKIATVQTDGDIKGYWGVTACAV